jgi:hypothetical protein
MYGSASCFAPPSLPKPLFPRFSPQGILGLPEWGYQVVLDVSMGKGYKYSLLSENLIVRGKNYAEHT